MMEKMFNISLFIVILCYVLAKGVEGTVSCRNNDNERVDWWVLYKPPPGEGVSGRNFSFMVTEPMLTSDSGADQTREVPFPWYKPKRWEGLMDITLPNMLHFTIAPLYKKSLVNRVAALNFEGSESSQLSAARGLLLADDSGGLYLGYTVPHLVDLTRAEPKFPESEITNGHMIVCLNMNLQTLNNVAVYVKHAAPKVVSLKVPNSLIIKLASWFYVNYNSADTTWARLHSAPLEFTNGNLSGLLMVRRPKQKHCLYKVFAKEQGTILDVYAPSDKPKRNICEKSYGIRSIDSISLNVNGEDVFVQYVNNNTDNAKFGVSTASNWQRRIPGLEQYWACFSGLERDADSGKGGLLMCLNNYLLWNGMDSLKIKEPECPR